MGTFSYAKDKTKTRPELSDLVNTRYSAVSSTEWVKNTRKTKAQNGGSLN